MELRHRWWGVVHDAMKEFGARLTRKRHLSGQRLVQQNAEAVHVGTLIDACPTQELLGRHIGRRTHRQCRTRPCRAVHHSLHHY